MQLLYVRQFVDNLSYLGIALDEEANNARGEDRVISTPDSKVTVAVIPTNEELAICQETAALVKIRIMVDKPGKPMYN